MLIEDVPGVGKTTHAKALAASVELEFNRVQCTPDLLPADVFGFSVFNPQTATFDFRRGPIFTNVLLVDEINRLRYASDPPAEAAQMLCPPQPLRR